MASQMIEHPSDYSFRLRLYEGLPSWIYDTLLERNILPEFCTLEDIRKNARQIEELSMRHAERIKGPQYPHLQEGPQMVLLRIRIPVQIPEAHQPETTGLSTQLSRGIATNIRAGRDPTMFVSLPALLGPILG